MKINTKYFEMIIKMRSEGKKYISLESVYGDNETLELKQSNYLDVVIYKNLNYRIFNLSLSFSAENLFFKKLVIDNLNLFDNHYSANVNLTIIWTMARLRFWYKIILLTKITIYLED